MKDEEAVVISRFSALPADSQEFVLGFLKFLVSNSDTEGTEGEE